MGRWVCACGLGTVRSPTWQEEKRIDRKMAV